MHAPQALAKCVDRGMLLITPRVGCDHHPSSTEEETEAWGKEDTCLWLPAAICQGCVVADSFHGEGMIHFRSPHGALLTHSGSCRHLSL